MVHSKTSYWVISFIGLAAAYLFLFELGNYEASDRIHYYNMFKLDFSGHFELGFRGMAYFFAWLKISPEVSLNLLAVLIFVVGYFCTWVYLQKPLVHLIAFGAMFFGILSLYHLIQIRMGFAVWVCLLIYYRYLKTNNKIYLLFLPLLTFLHISFIAFAALVIVDSFKKIPIWILNICTTIALLALIQWPDVFIKLAGLKTGYLIYFDPAKKNPLFFSPMIWSYFISCSILWLMSFKDFALRRSVEVVFLGLPFAILGFITSFDVLPRFSVPFLALSWIYFFKYIFEQKLSSLSPKLLPIIASLLVPVSVLYSYLRH